MKLIVAIIQPKKMDYLASAIRRAGISGLTACSVKGFGTETVESDWDLSGELSDKVRVEIVSTDESCDEVVRLIQKTVSTGKPGDGLIYVQEICYSVRIASGEMRTGECELHKSSD